MSAGETSRFHQKARPRRLALVPTLILVSTLLNAPASGYEGQPAGGADVMINDPGIDEDLHVVLPGQGGSTSVCITQSEVSMARWGSTLVAGWNDGGQCERFIKRRMGQPTGPISLSGFGYSHDGGRTWIDGGVLEDSQVDLVGDPVLAAGPGGDFYYATLVRKERSCEPGEPADPITARCRSQLVGVARSTDGGESWVTPVIASLGRDPRAEHDKPWIAVDTTDSPHRGTVYVAWTELLTTCTGSLLQTCSARTEVLFSRSTDGGASFAEPIQLSIPTLENYAFTEGIGTQIAVGPDGEIYVGWVSNANPPWVWFTKSLDGGATFSPPQAVSVVRPIGHFTNRCAPDFPKDEFVIKGDVRVFEWLSMTVDRSGSSDPESSRYNPYRGSIYLAVPHDADGEVGGDDVKPQGDESDIVFLSSRDGGATWSNAGSPGPLDRSPDPEDYPEDLLNDDGTKTDQFHPQVAVDSAGRVAVSWYDRQVSEHSEPSNWEMAVFARVSEDGGQTFGPSLQVSDEVFPPARTNPNTNFMSGCYMGEYNAVTGGDNEFLLAWGDNRDGVLSDAEGEEKLYPDPNVYFDRITFGSAAGEAPDGDNGEGSGSYGEPDAGGTVPGEPTVEQGGAPPTTGQFTPAPSAACIELSGHHVIGTPGRDLLRGTAGPDVLCGLGGRDRLIGLKRDDVLLGGAGRDVLVGGRGFDVCLGGAGPDDLQGCERLRPPP